MPSAQHVVTVMFTMKKQNKTKTLKVYKYTIPRLKVNEYIVLFNTDNYSLVPRFLMFSTLFLREQ